MPGPNEPSANNVHPCFVISITGFTANVRRCSLNLDLVEALQFLNGNMWVLEEE